MPEGPSIVLLKEEVQQFTDRVIINADGNTRLPVERLLHQKVFAFKSWGKHFLICFEGLTVRIHLMMFGSYRINERKATPVRLSLVFENGETNFYTCSVKFLEGDLDEHYDWAGDVMNEAWDPDKALSKLKKGPEKLVCDALLEQDIFAGVGNIIKNEVLYRIRVHPESKLGQMPDDLLRAAVEEARHYSFQFLEWKRHFELKKHWLAHTKTWCLRCELPIIRKYTGQKKRRSFICENCQILYT